MNALLEPLPEAAHPFLSKHPRLAWAAHFGWKFVTKWNDDQCPLFAAALAFFGLLSLFPVTIAALLLLARFLAGRPQVVTSVQAGLQNWVQDFFPGAAGNEISRELTHVVTGLAGRSDPTAVGLLAVVPLLWSGRAYFDTLAVVLNNVWPETTPRSFWGHQRVLWSTFLGAGALWLLSTLATFALRILQSLEHYLPSIISKNVRLDISFYDGIGRFVAWLLTLLMFWMIYRFLPHRETKQQRRIVLFAALVAAVLWEGAKWIFSAFLGNLSRYETTYGSVAGVVLTLLWIYFSSQIILAGAEAAAALESTRAAARNEKDPTDKNHSHESTTERPAA
jgi:membrane protein